MNDTDEGFSSTEFAPDSAAAQAPALRRRKKYVREREREAKTVKAEAGVTSYKLSWPGRRGAPDRMKVRADGLAQAATQLRETLLQLEGADLSQGNAELLVRRLIAKVISFDEHKSGTDVSTRQRIECRKLREAGLTVNVVYHA
jgi:hypothetical protein